MALSIKGEKSVKNFLVDFGLPDKKVEVKYYQGEKGFKEVCQRSLDNAKDEILFISNPEEWYKGFTDEYDKEYYIPSRLKRNLGVRTLVSQGEKAKLVKSQDKDID